VSHGLNGFIRVVPTRPCPAPAYTEAECVHEQLDGAERKARGHTIQDANGEAVRRVRQRFARASIGAARPFPSRLRRTSCELGLPVKVVVFNHGTLGFIELEQRATGFLDFGTSFKNPNFATMAETVGIHGIRIEDPAEVESGIAAALAHDGPVLVDAVVNREELSIPPKITLEMAKGFTLYMVKAVMSGRADEVLDLAVTNLWR
jgi:hypothetical protein